MARGTSLLMELKKEEVAEAEKEQQKTPQGAGLFVVLTFSIYFSQILISFCIELVQRIRHTKRK